MGKQFDLETQSWTDVIDIHEPDEVLPDIDAHGYLIGVYRGTIKANGSRLRAAIAALAFEKPKLAVVATKREDDLAERLEQALQASQQVMNGQSRQQVIEAKPVEPSVSEEAQPDHGKPFDMDNKSRFRRY
jgi:polysaccharide pyruvyl transferase WcaK-like protein